MTLPRVRSHVTNVLVIGTGAAGLRAATAATEAGTDVLVIGSRPSRDAHTVLAAGGINAALGTRDPEDTWQQHFADTYREGYVLGDPRTVEILTREAPAAVRELAEWGCRFARTETGELDQRFFGAHRYRRTCYAGDYTGRAVLFTLADRADALRIRIVEDQYVSRLLVADGVSFGAFGFNLHTGERTSVRTSPGSTRRCGSTSMRGSMTVRLRSRPRRCRPCPMGSRRSSGRARRSI